MRIERQARNKREVCDTLHVLAAEWHGSSAKSISAGILENDAVDSQNPGADILNGQCILIQ